MRFGLFYEHQNPRPWEDERAEHRLMQNALEQVVLADKLGIDYVWEVEHHFLEEYSHSSAPEVFLAAAAARTESIRLGHGIVALPPPINHPARTAERIATLDLVSGGRVEFGTGEQSSPAELGGFLVSTRKKRAMWRDALDAITRMFVEEPFAGWSSEFMQMPVRNVIPKPMQKPHPPLWVACSRRETIHLAARNGIGALSFSFVEPEEAGQWVEEYYRIISSEECVPAGFAVNPNVAVVLPMMCHHDEATAIERGIDGAHFFGYSLLHYILKHHFPGHTSIWEEFWEQRERSGFSRKAIVPEDAPLVVKVAQEQVGSLRGAIGTPEQVTDLVKRYEAVGVDQVIFVMQAGPNKHEHICESMELFASEVMPAFKRQAKRKENAKAKRLAPAIEAALARREPAREAPEGYIIDPVAEILRAQRVRRASRSSRSQLDPRKVARDVRNDTARAIQRRGLEALERVAERASDEQLHRLFGNPLALRTFFTGMTQVFDPRYAEGFEGDILFEIDPPLNGGAPTEPDRWTVRIEDGSAKAIHNAGDGEPAVRMRFSLPDAIRLITRKIEPAEMLLAEQDRVDFEGDPMVAARLPEMFGQPPLF